MPVFVHPWDTPSSPRLDRWMARWLAGMPAETHLSIIAMILGGAFDRLPASLRICFAHGGGSFAFWLGRLENAWHGRHDIVGVSARPPSTYVGRFSVDSVVFEPAALRTLVDTLGARNVMVGSDYPYPLGERPVGEVVRRSTFLTADERAAIMTGNAQRFLALEHSV
jgi:aminocarboxymuconate-semialdehyde decarboxylase